MLVIVNNRTKPLAVTVFMLRPLIYDRHSGFQTFQTHLLRLDSAAAYLIIIH